MKLAADNTLIPCVKMGVEARQQVCRDGTLEDAAITSKNHPLTRPVAALSDPIQQNSRDNPGETIENSNNDTHRTGINPAKIHGDRWKSTSKDDGQSHEKVLSRRAGSRTPSAGTSTSSPSGRA